MLGYVFWHVPFPDVSAHDYENALLAFHADLARSPPPEFKGSASYRVSDVPWLGGRDGYEDWCFVASAGALELLNRDAVKPERWNVHAGAASRMDIGYGGLYYHLRGEECPLSGARVIWLKRPRGIRYEQPLDNIIAGATGFLSAWRKLMVLGPGDEFALIGTSALKIVVPPGWQVCTIERSRLSPARAR